MKKGIIGRKIGMTQIFDEKGRVIPVTIIEAIPNVVSQVKTIETDGYNAMCKLQRRCGNTTRSACFILFIWLAIKINICKERTTHEQSKKCSRAVRQHGL